MFENQPSCTVASLHQWLCYILDALLQFYIESDEFVYLEVAFDFSASALCNGVLMYTTI